MKVKICGITSLEDALLCSQLGADALGFIFYKNSRRNIDYSDAGEIIAKLPPFTYKVGVFIDHKYEMINNISQTLGLNAVQLYEDQSFISKINLPVIKCFRIKNEFNFTDLGNYTGCSFLLDTYSENEFGGTGASFDWHIIPYELRNKIILAGGISESNIEYIYNEIRPAAVDLSSSIESSPGKKDFSKLKIFLNKINKLRYK
ncbi:MAG: N-(5'-phosphoribosyl)anthranilate isomerase [Ignavibacteriae bacterium HGW-Ignavibacteriae-3]|nr:MAG: N-(5'-phosphoribosyl)anthranilate isomerase [Ignavibacteriae bacterium HGW-Ignavibacteriae-3]